MSDRTYNRTFWLYAGLSLGLTGLYSLVLLPVFIRLCSDVIWLDTILPDLIEVLYTLTEILLFCVEYAFVIWAVLHRGGAGSKRFWIFTYPVILLKYILNVLFTFIATGFPALEDLPGEIWDGMIPAVLEVLQFTVVLAVAWAVLDRYRRNTERLKASLRKMRATGAVGIPDPPFPVPYRKILDFSNPVLLSSFCAALLLSAVRIVSRLIYDFSGVLAPSLGKAGVTQILWAAAYYLFDIALCILAYLLILFLILKLTVRKTEKNATPNPEQPTKEDDSGS